MAEQPRLHRPVVHAKPVAVSGARDALISPLIDMCALGTRLAFFQINIDALIAFTPHTPVTRCISNGVAWTANLPAFVFLVVRFCATWTPLALAPCVYDTVGLRT